MKENKVKTVEEETYRFVPLHRFDSRALQDCHWVTILDFSHLLPAAQSIVVLPSSGVLKVSHPEHFYLRPTVAIDKTLDCNIVTRSCQRY